ncbi:MAG: glucose-6-phosphate isomerase [Pseudomonadales bacterium]|nr:glucose-6-phosphate isomerase [Pseudomonadales bacterium]
MSQPQSSVSKLSFSRPDSPQWQALARHIEDLRTSSLAGLFQQDDQRFEHFSIEAAGLTLDYSKNFLTEETLKLLLALAEKCQLSQAIADMFDGCAINTSEQRPALHVALRSPQQNTVQEQAVHACLNKMQGFVEAVLEGNWTGHEGKAITDVVNIGIGGSDLGPAMVYQALTPYHVPGLNCHFVSNVDPAHLLQTLTGLNPETTLFIVASKSFSTLETSMNAILARQWFLDSGAPPNALSHHFVAVSANVDKAAAFGIDPANIFPLWDWVGGRYSLWSAIGLPIALGVGMENFRALLAGAHIMDEHFRTAPARANMPVLMGLLTIGYLNFFGAETQVVLPYAQNLHLFPAFLQQLDMESLGKSVHRDGSAVDTTTGGIIWGSAGTNGQHSFHQLLHQGTHLIPADFIVAAQTHYEQSAESLAQHRQLLANCFSQSQALMLGKTLTEATTELQAQGLDPAAVATLAPHKVIAGNRPSNTLLMQKLTPRALGSLIAAYEHKVYVQSVILGIDAFDQWGVELGKTLSTTLHQALERQDCKEEQNVDSSAFDSSTRGLINYYQKFCRNPA